tara:strand:- start:825 stop:1658 length:834 start_codon:yes stop_codon:yes gene_type:complete
MKKLLIGGILALSSMGVNAAVVSAGGISWDDTNLGPGGVSNQVNFQQWFTTTPTFTDINGTAANTADDYQRIISDLAVAGAVGTELVGLGEFYSFNDGRDPGGFCDSGTCELTFAFGGLVVSSFAGTTPLFDTSNAWFNIYIDETPNFDSAVVADTTLGSGAHALFAEAQDGLLFAALDFDSFILDGTILGGESEAELSIRTTAGLGLADVQAAWNFNSMMSDIGLTAGAIFDNSLYSSQGNGQSIGVPVQASAPATIALFGLGLIGLAAVSRRRKS